MLIKWKGCGGNKGIFVRYSDVLSAIGMETPESKERILSRLGVSSSEYSLTWDGNCPIFGIKSILFVKGRRNHKMQGI